MIACHTPRRIFFATTKPAAVYSDACGAGHLGVTLLHEGTQTVISTHTPRRFNESSGISEKEQAGAALGLLAATIVAPWHPVLLICDNTAACATIIRGSSKTAMGRQIASVFWTIAARVGVAVWVEEVVSDLSSGDAPSRLCNFPEKAASVNNFAHGHPIDSMRMFLSKATPLQAQYSFSPAEPKFGPPFPCDFAKLELCLLSAGTDESATSSTHSMPFCPLLRYFRNHRI